MVPRIQIASRPQYHMLYRERKDGHILIVAAARLQYLCLFNALEPLLFYEMVHNTDALMHNVKKEKKSGCSDKITGTLCFIESRLVQTLIIISTIKAN